MRRRGVEQPHAGLADRLRHFLRRVVGQAENGDVDLAHQLQPRVEILALVGIDRNQLDAGHARQTLADAQPRGARFAVDEYPLGHDRLLWLAIRTQNKKGVPSRGRPLFRGPGPREGPYYRFENWKLRRAPGLPYFLRSTTRLSRVRKPLFFNGARSSGS